MGIKIKDTKITLESEVSNKPINRKLFSVTTKPIQGGRRLVEVSYIFLCVYFIDKEFHYASSLEFSFLGIDWKFIFRVAIKLFDGKCETKINKALLGLIDDFDT